MALFILFAIHLLMIIKINYIDTYNYFETNPLSNDYYFDDDVDDIEPFPHYMEYTRERDDPIHNASLYGLADQVRILQGRKLEWDVYHSAAAWLVQFYDSREDPPVTASKTLSKFWKRFAASISHWQPILQFGVFDCAHDRITGYEICDKYQAWDYSTFRYYRPFLNYDDKGELVSAPLEDGRPLAPAWRAEIIKHLENTKNEWVIYSWLDFSPLNSEESIESVWKAYNGRFLVLVVENVESYVGRELIMDLNLTPVAVRYTNNVEFANPKEELPQVLVIRPDEKNSRTQVKLTNTTQAGVYHSVRNYLQTQGLTIDDIRFDTELDNELSLSRETFPKPSAQCEKILGKSGGDQIDKKECVKLRQFRLAFPVLSRLIWPTMPEI